VRVQEGAGGDTLGWRYRMEGGPYGGYSMEGTVWIQYGYSMEVQSRQHNTTWEGMYRREGERTVDGRRCDGGVRGSAGRCARPSQTSRPSLWTPRHERRDPTESHGMRRRGRDVTGRDRTGRTGQDGARRDKDPSPTLHPSPFSFGRGWSRWWPSVRWVVRRSTVRHSTAQRATAGVRQAMCSTYLHDKPTDTVVQIQWCRYSGGVLLSSKGSIQYSIVHTTLYRTAQYTPRPW
jgi:hypothetical protein